MAMVVASLDDDLFNNLSSSCSEVVGMSSRSKYYATVTTNWVKNNVSSRIGCLYDCYVGWMNATRSLACSANMRFCKMTVNMYEVCLTEYVPQIC